MTSKDLVYAETSNTILLGYEIGTGEYEGRKLSIVASGNLVRFSLDGIDGHVDLPLNRFAGLACEWLTTK